MERRAINYFIKNSRKIYENQRPKDNIGDLRVVNS